MAGLVGAIPTQLGAGAIPHQRLETLQLGHTAISGSIPTQIGKLLSLQTISVPHARLSSSLPSELGFLTDLRVLDIGNNSFMGRFPETYPYLGTVLLGLSECNLGVSSRVSKPIRLYCASG